MDAAIDLYTRVVGFELVRNEPSYYASLRNGSVVLGIGPVSKLPAEGRYFTRDIADQPRGFGVEIVLEVDDVDAWHRGVLASGHPVFEPLQVRPWGLREFRIVDPDGSYLRITSRR